MTAATYEAWDKIDLDFSIDTYDAASMQPLLLILIGKLHRIRHPYSPPNK
jgi:hypothetical protein